MFGQIRRHQKWLWILISGAVIISFVWYFNPNQQAGGGGFADDAVVGTIYGDTIDRKEYQDALREATIHYLFANGQWPDDSEFMRRARPVEREARSRVFLVRKLEDLNIKVSDKAVADWIANAFQDPETKAFRKDVYDRFLSNLPQRGLRAADFERYARHQVGITHLAALAGAPGKLITPQEAEREFRQANEKADTQFALFSTSNYLAQVEIKPEAISQFFTNRASLYRLPERVQVSYVAFPVSNYLAVADQKLASETNLNEQINAFYLQRGPQFYTDPTGQTMTPEAAKAQIRDEIRHDAALVEARRDAIAFATALAEIPVNTNSPNPAENLESLAIDKKLHFQISEPFGQFEGPRSLNVPEQFARIAFSLTPQEPILSEPVVGEDAVYVFGLRRRLPSEIPPFETLADRVTEDYRRAEAMRMMREAGQAFAAAVTNGLAAGKSFEAIATEAGVPVVNAPPVPREGQAPVEGFPPQVDPSIVRGTAFTLPAGHTSGFIPSRDGGLVLFVEQFLPVQEAELKEELPGYLQDLRRSSANRAFNNWFNKELALADLRLAGDEQLEEQ